LVFLFLVGRESGDGCCGYAHLFEHGAGFLRKFLERYVVAEAPGLDPREVPQVGNSPANYTGEITDILRNPARSVGDDNEAR
jgi:hypothetical protein